jgi:hypothetical protein
MALSHRILYLMASLGWGAESCVRIRRLQDEDSRGQQVGMSGVLA